MNALPQGAAIVDHTALGITLASGEAGFAARLYAAGAWLVLPAGLPGCAAGAKGLGALPRDQ